MEFEKRQKLSIVKKKKKKLDQLLIRTWEGSQYTDGIGTQGVFLGDGHVQ